MQNGSLIRAERQRGPAVWEFRWRELAGNGKRTHRRIVLGSVDRLVDEAAARMRDKLVTGRFFVERMLPETALHLARIQLGAANLMELPAAAF